MTNTVTKSNQDISNKLAQLDAIMTIASSDKFSDFSEITRGDALWLCSDLTKQIREQFNASIGDLPQDSER